MKINIKEDKLDAELAQEFKEYLNLIGEEISDPLMKQVYNNSEYADKISNAINKFDEDFQADIQSSVQESLHNLNKQVITIYSKQQSNIDKRLNEIDQGLNERIRSYEANFDKRLNEIDQGLNERIRSYEAKTTQRLLKHRWIETVSLAALIICSATLIYIFGLDHRFGQPEHPPQKVSENHVVSQSVKQLGTQAESASGRNDDQGLFLNLSCNFNSF